MPIKKKNIVITGVGRIGSGVWWCMPIIPSALEAEIRKIVV
jgi:hypothetical protein